MTKLKLSYFGHIMRRQGSLEKAIMVGKTEGCRKRGKSAMGWMDSIKEATGKSLQELSRAVEGRTRWNHSFKGSPGVTADSMARK